MEGGDRAVLWVKFVYAHGLSDAFATGWCRVIWEYCEFSWKLAIRQEKRASDTDQEKKGRGAGE